MGRVQDRCAIVTGGARGMGAAHARKLVHEGAFVVIADVIDEIGQALSTELGDRARFVSLDVRDPDQWTYAVEQAREFGGEVSILIGFISTPMLAGADESALTAALPIARTGTPEEVADLALYLVAEATYSTGSEFVIDGGIFAGIKAK